jgi:hypothetical protein
MTPEQLEALKREISTRWQAPHEGDDMVAHIKQSELDALVAAAEERDRLRDVEQAAHDLLCWTHQHAINVEPADYSRHVKDLHPGVWNEMNTSEQELYAKLMEPARQALKEGDV